MRRSTTDFSPIINKIISSSADALLGGGHYADGATLARQLYDQKANLKYVSLLVAPDSPEFASLGPAAFGITVPSQWEIQVTYKPQFGPTSVRNSPRTFEAKFKAAPDYHAASGYAGGSLLQHAIEQAGSIDPEKVVAALNAIDITTFFGHIKFATDPGTTDCRSRMKWCSRSGRRKTASWSEKWCGRRRRKTADLLYPLH